MDPSTLPVWTVMSELVRAVKTNRNVVLTAPPGSGKTTQVPQALLDNNLVKGAIIVVQPRRVACRAVGKRVAEEREIEIGAEVGYIVRYDGKKSDDTRILFVTDGVLLRFLENDPALSWAGAVIFDEFHERRAITDVALGLLKTEQARRPSLRLLVMSATIVSSDIANYLNAVQLSTEGRAFPVDIHYSPAKDHEEALKAVAPAVASVHATKRPGDILVFLAGKEEIRRVEKAIKALKLKFLVVLPLHGELPKEEQDKVFEPAPGRKVILATNVAETSVTIPGVSTVIDTGYEKRADFDPALGINRLALVRIARSSADQRAGRAGREAPGYCVRLWSQTIHQELYNKVPAEMLRTDLASVILTLKSVGIIDPLSFDYLDYPSAERLSAAEEYLVQLGAVGPDCNLTHVGWRMLRLPLPPRYARMVVESEKSGCLKEIASIAALMAGRPILLEKSGLRSDDAPRIRFARDDSSDFFSMLEMFRVAREHEWSSRWCDKHGINSDALHEAMRLRHKIIKVAFKRGSPQTNRKGNPAAIRRCILAGLIDRVAAQQSVREYRLANGLSCTLDGSTVVKGRIIAAANVRLRFQKTESDVPSGLMGFITRVDHNMLAQVAPHLLTKLRLPVALDTRNSLFTIREEIRYQELILDAHEQQVDIPEALQVVADQRKRAKQNSWHRVDVLPGIGHKSHVVWNGEKIKVEAHATGPHWASVYGSNPPKIIIREQIVLLPGIEEPSEPFPQSLRDKVKRTSSALSKLLGNS